MRYVRLRTGSGSIASGVLDADGVAVLDRPFGALLASGEVELRRAADRALSNTSRLPLGAVDLLPAVEPLSVVAPGPTTSRAGNARDLSAHREFYLKAATTLHPGDTPVPYRNAIGVLSYRAQLGVVMKPDSGRSLTPDEALASVFGVVLVAELLSVDLLRVGWEGTMWHTRFGEGGSFDGATVCGPWLATADTFNLADARLADAWGAWNVDANAVGEQLAYVSRWMPLGPELLVLAGSRHGPRLVEVDREPVVEFPPDEPRIRPGDVIEATGDGLGEVRTSVATVASEARV